MTNQELDFEPLELAEGTPLRDLKERRQSHGNDISVLIEDWHSRRGTGKTTLSLRLGAALDESGLGLTFEKCSLEPAQIINNYTEQPKKSALIMDEGEAGLDKYQAGSYINRAMRKIISMGRIEEKYIILNAPAGSQLDTDLRTLFDVVIFVQRKGLALVHFVKRNPYKETKFLDPVQQIEWKSIDEEDLREVYNKLSREKQKRLRDEGDKFISEKEHEKRMKAYREKTKRGIRDDTIKRLINDTDLGPADIAPAFDITQTRIGQIARE